MLTAGLIALILCLILFFVIIWLIEERNLSDDGCVVLGSLLFLLLLFGAIWLYSGSYDKGYKQGAIDTMKGKVEFEITTKYQILKKEFEK